jgi:O-antigen/teichoic acid export membrane protein
MFGLRVEPALLLAQLSFGGRTVVGTLAERLHFRANTFMLNALVSVGATGVFSVALGLAETLWYVPTSLGLVLFSRSVKGQREGAAIASAMTRTMLAPMALLALPLALAAPALVELAYGAPFREAGVALQILLPGVLAYSIVAVLTHALIAWGAPGRVTVVLTIGLAVNLAANVMLIPALGMNGAALASTISYTVTAALTLALYRAMTGQGLAQVLLLRASDVKRLRSLARDGLARLGSARPAAPPA